VTAWHEQPIYKKHDRDALDCGEEALNEFPRRPAVNSLKAPGLGKVIGMNYLLARSDILRCAGFF